MPRRGNGAVQESSCRPSPLPGSALSPTVFADFQRCSDTAVRKRKCCCPFFPPSSALLPLLSWLIFKDAAMPQGQNCGAEMGFLPSLSPCPLLFPCCFCRFSKMQRYSGAARMLRKKSPASRPLLPGVLPPPLLPIFKDASPCSALFRAIARSTPQSVRRLKSAGSQRFQDTSRPPPHPGGPVQLSVRLFFSLCTGPFSRGAAGPVSLFLQNSPKNLDFPRAQRYSRDVKLHL